SQVGRVQRVQAQVGGRRGQLRPVAGLRLRPGRLRAGPVRPFNDEPRSRRPDGPTWPTWPTSWTVTTEGWRSWETERASRRTLAKPVLSSGGTACRKSSRLISSTAVPGSAPANSGSRLWALRGSGPPEHRGKFRGARCTVARERDVSLAPRRAACTQGRARCT